MEKEGGKALKVDTKITKDVGKSIKGSNGVKKWHGKREGGAFGKAEFANLWQQIWKHARGWTGYSCSTIKGKGKGRGKGKGNENEAKLKKADAPKKSSGISKPKPPAGSPPTKLLPPNWEEHWSKEHNMPYYWNKVTKASKWIRP